MLFLNFSRIFKLKGIHSPFSKLTSMGYSPNYATKIANNRISQINLVQIERFCQDFNCTPNDIIDFRPFSNQSIPDDHALHSLTKKEITNEVLGKINALPLEKIQQIHDIIKNME